MTGNGAIRRLLWVLAVLGVVAGAALWGLRRAGHWLVDPDPLAPAPVIAVLSGRTPYRAMEAAAIYRQGWAREIWLLQDESTRADADFARLGIHHPSEQEWDQQVLEHMGVPEESIRIIQPPTSNTVSEITLIAREMRREGKERVILVTSPVHTRRCKLIWSHVVGDHPQAILRYDCAEPSDPDHWWRGTQDIQDVEHELLGLINAHLGFAAAPAR